MMENVDLLDKNAWDDSALIKSWNQALKEYRKYHSIHAKGESLEDVLRQEELLKETVEKSDQELVVDDAGDGEDDGDATTSKSQQPQPKGQSLDDEQRSGIEDKRTGDLAGSSMTCGPKLPEILLGRQEEENKPLKNLMMSWYYAGYYTGYFEGQTAVQQHSGK